MINSSKYFDVETGILFLPTDFLSLSSKGETHNKLLEKPE